MLLGDGSRFLLLLGAIAATTGSLDSMPLLAMSPREVNYASMSDDEMLG
jgi:hypothetical protein